MFGRPNRTMVFSITDATLACVIFFGVSLEVATVWCCTVLLY